MGSWHGWFLCLSAKLQIFSLKPTVNAHLSKKICAELNILRKNFRLRGVKVIRACYEVDEKILFLLFLGFSSCPSVFGEVWLFTFQDDVVTLEELSPVILTSAFHSGGTSRAFLRLTRFFLSLATTFFLFLEACKVVGWLVVLT